MGSPSLPRTFHARPSSIGTWIVGLVVLCAVLVGLGAVWNSTPLMIRAGGGLVTGLIFLGIWLVKRVKAVTVEPGAVLLDARRFAVAGARVTDLETRELRGQVRRSFWMSLPDGSGGELKRGFTDMLWPVDELYAALLAAGVEKGMPYPN